jgi:hypothetical protein
MEGTSMKYSIIVHLASGEPIEGDIEEMPHPQANFIAVKNPHRRSNRELDWLDHRTNTLLIAFSHIVSIEIVLAHSEQEIVTKYGYDLH